MKSCSHRKKKKINNNKTNQSRDVCTESYQLTGQTDTVSATHEIFHFILQRGGRTQCATAGWKSSQSVAEISRGGHVLVFGG